MRFTCCPNLFLASPWLEILKLVILLILSSPKLAAIFLTLGKSKLTLIVSLLTLGRSELFYSFGQEVRLQKTIQTLTVKQKILEPSKNLAQVIFNDSMSSNQNRLTK